VTQEVGRKLDFKALRRALQFGICHDTRIVYEDMQLPAPAGRESAYRMQVGEIKPANVNLGIPR
jgi:hypothetical protein